MVDSSPLRLCMWSGPRNISTALMRAFENRPDTAVIDEPFYATWLAASGADHPMRDAVLAAQPTDWRAVVETLLGPVPGGRRVFYQKHMAHHVTPEMDLGRLAACRHAFLIRPPEAVLVSYVARRGEATLADIGVAVQAELFDREAQRLGVAPPVIDADDVLADPAGTLGALCAAVGLPFLGAMLAWPAGPRDTDGVWAPAWYDAVIRSTGFARPAAEAPIADLTGDLARVADLARPFYDTLSRHALNRRGGVSGPAAPVASKAGA